MSKERFSQVEMEQATPAPSAGFLVMPVANANSCSTLTPLQWLYQQLYVQAVQANQRPTMRDLFAVMN